MFLFLPCSLCLDPNLTGLPTRHTMHIIKTGWLWRCSPPPLPTACEPLNRERTRGADAGASSAEEDSPLFHDAAATTRRCSSTKSQTNLCKSNEVVGISTT